MLPAFTAGVSDFGNFDYLDLTKRDTITFIVSQDQKKSVSKRYKIVNNSILMESGNDNVQIIFKISKLSPDELTLTMHVIFDKRGTKVGQDLIEFDYTVKKE